MVKRPLGLAKAAKMKKQKQEEPQDKESAGKADLNIDVDESVDDEALAEIYGLFKTFDTSAKSNPKLAMGLVHECDALLRERQRLPARFHLCYGIALLTLATFQDDSEDVAEGETPDAFVQAAIDRFDVGLEQEKFKPLLAAKASAQVAHLDEQLRKIKSSKKKAKLVQEKSELIDSIKDLIDESKGDDDCRTAEGVMALQEFAVSLESLKLVKLSNKIFEWSSKQWPGLLQSTDERAQKLAWRGLGELHLAAGQNAFGELMGEDDDKEENSDDDEDGDGLDLSNPLAKTVKQELTKAVEYLSKVATDDKPGVYAQLAEAKISLGNVTENESEEQKKIYNEAIRLLKKAQKLGAGDFHDMIDSLED